VSCRTGGLGRPGRCFTFPWDPKQPLSKTTPNYQTVNKNPIPTHPKKELAHKTHFKDPRSHVNTNNNKSYTESAFMALEALILGLAIG
jgi:hypothetical protein